MVEGVSTPRRILPTRSVKGHSLMSVTHSSGGAASNGRRSDVRFAAMLSAGMIATVVTLGALLAPLLAWNGGSAPNARDRSQTVRLSEPPARATAPATAFSADRPGHVSPAAVRRAIAMAADGQVALTLGGAAPRA